MKQQISTMLLLQDGINQQVHPQWREQNFAWYRAVWVECGELLDHYGWKWWKHQKADIDQVKLELIDIWHFGLSIMLLENREVDAIGRALEGALQQTAGEFKADLEAFTAATLLSKSFDIEKFACLMRGVDLDFNELFLSYVGKNVLNRFRQDHGYQTGAYQKIWAGREDNEHLVDLSRKLDSESETFQEDLYQGLKRLYLA